MDTSLWREHTSALLGTHRAASRRWGCLHESRHNYIVFPAMQDGSCTHGGRYGAWVHRMHTPRKMCVLEGEGTVLRRRQIMVIKALNISPRTSVGSGKSKYQQAEIR